MGKLKLNTEIVKYIFPGLHPQIILGEDGWVAHEFIRLLPRKLGIVIPNEVESSNYNSIFPVPFEGYFRDLHDSVSRLSRLIEAPVPFSIPDLEIEGMVGEIVEHNTELTIFRFDNLLENHKKQHVLCRAKAERLSVEASVAIVNTNPIFLESAINFDGVQYDYWIMPITSLFADPKRLLFDMLYYAGFLQKDKSPF